MRAALLYGPGDLRIEDVTEPVAGPGEIVLAIGAAATCGTDVKSVKRGHPTIASYPARLGHEFAGTVEAVGEGVTNVAAGDVVFCANSAPCGVCRQCTRGRESLCEDLLYVLGGFAEKLLVPERVVAKNLHPLHETVPLEVAPLAEPLACAVHALDALTVEGPVAILGAGSLGLMLTALVADLGGEPVVLDPHPERLAAARRFGAAHTIQATRGHQDVAAAREHRPDLVIEAVGRCSRAAAMSPGPRVAWMVWAAPKRRAAASRSGCGSRTIGSPPASATSAVSIRPSEPPPRIATGPSTVTTSSA